MSTKNSISLFDENILKIYDKVMGEIILRFYRTSEKPLPVTV